MLLPKKFIGFKRNYASFFFSFNITHTNFNVKQGHIINILYGNLKEPLS